MKQSWNRHLCTGKHFVPVAIGGVERPRSGSMTRCKKFLLSISTSSCFSGSYTCRYLSPLRSSTLRRHGVALFIFLLRRYSCWCNWWPKIPTVTKPVRFPRFHVDHIARKKSPTVREPIVIPLESTESPILDGSLHSLFRTYDFVWIWA